MFSQRSIGIDNAVNINISTEIVRVPIAFKGEEGAGTVVVDLPPRFIHAQSKNPMLILVVVADEPAPRNTLATGCHQNLVSFRF